MTCHTFTKASDMSKATAKVSVKLLRYNDQDSIEKFRDQQWVVLYKFHTDREFHPELNNSVTVIPG